MPSLSFIASALVLWGAANTPSALAKVIQPPVVPAVSGQPTSQGCYASVGRWREGISSESKDGTRMYNSPNWCNHRCTKEKSPVAALQRNACYCLDAYPPRSLLVDDDRCNRPCPAYPVYACGSDDTFSVYNVGIRVNVEHMADEEVEGADAGEADVKPEGGHDSAPPEPAKEEL